MKKSDGYTILLLMFAVFVMSIGLMIAVPVWQTQIQREKEEELIFRGKQYVEAIRLFQSKKPGAFPRDFEELIEEKCLRKLFEDPMSPDGKWNLILMSQAPASSRTRQPTRRTTRGSRTRDQATTQRSARSALSVQRVLIAPQAALSAIDFPQIIGVVSASTQNSIKIYYEQKSYDKWLFFYGQDPNKMPEIIYYGQKENN
ncbi:MAG: type II secretion system protein [Candidatus Aminicenantes bacterium]|nr:MAG: type II secretion system protein [Candidatus Aminicenantes bacterium]